MPECTLCGGCDFNLYDGYYYCTVCQTQSQDIQEMELTIAPFTTSRVDRTKKKLKRGRKNGPKNKLGDGPEWTTWQAFNFILKGMTEELIALGVPDELEQHVLQLWAAYLHFHQIAFCSRSRDLPPRLNYPFKYRDAKVIYDLDTISLYSGRSGCSKPRRRRRAPSSRASTGSSKTTAKNYLKRFMHKSLYDSQISTGVSGDDVNQTLESIAGPSTKGSVDIPRKKKTIKKMYLSKKGFLKQQVPSFDNRLIIGKSKLLCILYMAMLQMNQPIQISDLLRFIHDGSLSYAKTSHMLPAEMHFGRTDSLFINYNKQQDMPTHGWLAGLLPLVAVHLRMKTLPVPQLPLLIRRYATELLLPDGFADLAVNLLLITKPPRYMKIRRLKRVPAFDLIAMSALLVVLKLMLGMDGISERRHSHFAEAVNRLDPDARLFSFNNWQRAIECRNTVLSTYHFPTHEQLAPNEKFNPGYAAEFVSGCLKDPHLRDRQRSMDHIKNETEVVRGVECVVTRLMEASKLSRRQPSGPNFKSSLSPGVTHLQELVSWLAQSGDTEPPWVAILNQNWSSAKITHFTNPQPYIDLLKNNNFKVKQYPEDWLQKHMHRAMFINDTMSKLPQSALDKEYSARIGESDLKKVKVNRIHRSCGLSHKVMWEEVYCRDDHQYWLLRPSAKSSSFEKEDSESTDSNTSSDSLPMPKPERKQSSKFRYSFNARCPFKIWNDAVFETEIAPKFSSTWLWLLTQCSYLLHASRRDVYAHVLQMEHRLIRLFKD